MPIEVIITVKEGKAQITIPPHDKPLLISTTEEALRQFHIQEYSAEEAAMTIVAYLDCGCAIRVDDSRAWCPTCESNLGGFTKHQHCSCHDTLMKYLRLLIEWADTKRMPCGYSRARLLGDAEAALRAAGEAHTCEHEWKEGKQRLDGTPVRECKKCGRVQYFTSIPVGTAPRWRISPL